MYNTNKQRERFHCLMVNKAIQSVLLFFIFYYNDFFDRFSRLIEKNAKNTVNPTTIITTCHMTAYEWWRSNGGSTPPPLITRHMTNCNKSCKKNFVPNIARLINDHCYRKHWDWMMTLNFLISKYSAAARFPSRSQIFFLFLTPCKLKLQFGRPRFWDVGKRFI